MSSDSKSVINFLAFLRNLGRKTTINGGSVSEQKHVEKTCNYLSSLSDRELSKLVSDKYWNKYPFYTCWPKRTDLRSYGSTIGSVVHEMCQYDSRVKDILVRKSDGIFLSYTIDYTFGKDRLKASSRALKSKDNRARLRSARVLPIRKIKGLITDSNSSIRNLALKRIGIDNCAESLLDDKSTWIRTKAIMASDTLTDEYIKEEIARLETSSDPDGWEASIEMLALVKKLSDEELLYFLDLGDRWGRISEHIKKRLEYSSVDIKTKGRSLA